MSAFGQSLPSSLGLFKDVLYTHMHHLVTWFQERVWDFSALSGLTTVSRRVVKLAIPHYLLGQFESLIPSTGSGLGFGGHGTYNGCDFGTRKDR